MKINKVEIDDDILGSDKFLDLSTTTQCLYFHMCINADKDGNVNNTRSILRYLNLQISSLKSLIEAQLVTSNVAVELLSFYKCKVITKHGK